MSAGAETGGIQRRIAAYLLAAAVLGLACSIQPLYSGNQDGYFLHGLAQGGYGFLSDDWRANATDPFPAISKLVELVYASGHPKLFYLFQFIFCGIYAVSLIGIAVEVFRIRRGIFEYAVLFATLVVVDSYALGYFSQTRFGFDVRSYVPDTMPGDYFQPSTFGSVLFLSIYLFIKRHRAAAILCLGIVVNFHPVYMLGAGSLALSYMVVAFREEKTLKQPLLLGAMFFVVALPELIYYATQVGPTSAEHFARAADIMSERSRHLYPQAWMHSPAFLLRFVVMLLAVYFARGTPLLPIILVPLSIGLALVGAQLLTDSDKLRTLYSYRMFVLVGPVATACVIGWMAARFFQFRLVRNRSARKVLGGLAVTGTLLLAAFGANATRWWFERKAESSLAPTGCVPTRT